MNASDAINALAALPTCLLIEDFPGFNVAIHNICNGMIVALPLKASGLSFTAKIAEDLAVIIPIHEIVDQGKPSKSQFINYIHGKDIQKLVDAWTAQAVSLDLLKPKPKGYPA